MSPRLRFWIEGEEGMTAAELRVTIDRFREATLPSSAFGLTIYEATPDQDDGPEHSNDLDCRRCEGLECTCGGAS